RSPSAKALASLDKLRDKASGGSLWGQSRVLLVWVTPPISLPVGALFSQPAPALSPWYKTDKVPKKPAVPPTQPPPRPPPTTRPPPPPPPPRRIPPKHPSRGADLPPSRPNSPMSGCTRSWRMPSRARRLVAMALRLCAVAYQGSRQSAASRTFGLASV